MKRSLLSICSILLAFALTACGVAAQQSAILPAVSIPSQSDTQVSTDAAESLPEAELPKDSANPTQGNAKSEIPPLTKPPAPPEKEVLPSKPLLPEPAVPEPPPPEPTPPADANHEAVLEETAVHSIQVDVGGKVFSATLEENETAAAFAQMLQGESLPISMRDYSGFEKVGSLGGNLPERNYSMTAQAGDIVLYSGNQICVFYGSNLWSYTRLGKIDDLSGWAEALGSTDIEIIFSIPS